MKIVMLRFQEILFFLILIIAMTPLAFLLMPIVVPVLIFAALLTAYKLWTTPKANENH